MITTGSVPRAAAAERFGFLAEHYRGRRTAIKAFTHTTPEYVFWIYPDGTLFDLLPVPLDDDALVVSDNADLYGTVRDLIEREANGGGAGGTGADAR